MNREITSEKVADLFQITLNIADYILWYQALPHENGTVKIDNSWWDQDKLIDEQEAKNLLSI